VLQRLAEVVSQPWTARADLGRRRVG